MDALNFLRQMLCFILLSRLFQMVVPRKVKVRWPKAVSSFFKKGCLKRIAVASKPIVYIRAFAKFAAEVAWS